MIVKETVKVEGMSCGHCVASVKKAVESLSGIKSVDVSLEKKQAVVEFDSDAADLTAIKNAIEDQGYDVV